MTGQQGEQQDRASWLAVGAATTPAGGCSRRSPSLAPNAYLRLALWLLLRPHTTHHTRPLLVLPLFLNTYHRVGQVSLDCSALTCPLPLSPLTMYIVAFAGL